MGKASTPKGELLFEIGTEELPSTVFPLAIQSMKEHASDLLSENRISAENIEVFGTPRRLVLHATGIPRVQSASVIEIFGPPRSAAYDESGNPTSAALGFAKSQNVSVKDLKIKKKGKGDYLFTIRKDPALPSQGILRTILPQIVLSISFLKTMRWNDRVFRFSRPIRWLVSVFNGKPVPIEIAGIKSSNLSRGHRFLSSKSITVKNWENFKKDLAKNHVVIDPETRRKLINVGIDKLAKTKRGLALKDEALVEEAVYLTEDPVVMIGDFDKKFLEMPSEIPVTAMREHQGYFPLQNKKGKLQPFFIFVSNGKTSKPALVRAGNERVLRARLEDARFYYDQDRKVKLDEIVPRLGDLVYHAKLGSIYLKSERIRQLASTFSGDEKENKPFLKKIERSAFLCKTDLLTGMVREFPALQGIMGREYARIQGEDREVCEAIAEHYFPRQADDPRPPKTRVGKLLTVADRLDALVGFFGVGLKPTGSVDPFGLRRQGLGLVQVLLDDIFKDFSLSGSISKAIDLYKENGITFRIDSGTLHAELSTFLGQRMVTFLSRRNKIGDLFRKDLSDVVFSAPLENPLNIYLRYIALTVLQKEPDFEPLMVLFKRASRIIPDKFSGKVQPDLFKEKSEKKLYESLLVSKKKFQTQMDSQRYPDALRVLSHLRKPIDEFFEGVMVMDQDKSIRENRLSLLSEIRDLFEQFGDFTRVVIEDKEGSR